MRFEAYDPKKHKGQQLFEAKTKQKENEILVSIEPSDVAEEDARAIPWYFLVNIDGIKDEVAN